MKNKWIGCRGALLLLVVAALCVSGEVFGAARKPRVSLKVKVTSDKNKDSDETEVETLRSIVSTYTQTEEETVSLQLKLENKSDQDLKGKLEWYFVSDNLKGRAAGSAGGKSKGNKGSGRTYVEPKAVKVVFSPGAKEITLAAREKLEEVLVSAPFVFEEKTVDTEILQGKGKSTVRDTRSGDEFKGYAVLFTIDGEMIAGKSTMPSYLREEWLEKFRNYSAAGANTTSKKKNNKRNRKK